MNDEGLLMQPLDAEIFRQVANALPVGVYIVGWIGGLPSGTEAGEKIKGYLSQEVIGRPCHTDMLVHCGAQGMPVCASAGCLLTCCYPIESRWKRHCLHATKTATGYRSTCDRSRSKTQVEALSPSRNYFSSREANPNCDGRATRERTRRMDWAVPDRERDFTLGVWLSKSVSFLTA
jgi:hypothetical protein